MTKTELMALIAEYVSKVNVYSAIEATRLATDRRSRGESANEASLKQQITDLRVSVERAVNELPIE